MSGKGDKRRPRQVSREEYEKRFEKAFGREKDKEGLCPKCYALLVLHPTRHVSECSKCDWYSDKRRLRNEIQYN